MRPELAVNPPQSGDPLCDANPLPDTNALDNAFFLPYLGLNSIHSGMQSAYDSYQPYGVSGSGFFAAVAQSVHAPRYGVYLPPDNNVWLGAGAVRKTFSMHFTCKFGLPESYVTNTIYDGPNIYLSPVVIAPEANTADVVDSEADDGVPDLQAVPNGRGSAAAGDWDEDGEDGDPDGWEGDGDTGDPASNCAASAA